MEQPASGAFWDAIRSWADSAGLLVPQPVEGDPPRPVRPQVPQGVCAACPICQAAATLDQVNPQILADLTLVMHSVLDGLGAALAAAADQRASAPRSTAAQRADGRPGASAGPTPPGAGGATQDG